MKHWLIENNQRLLNKNFSHFRCYWHDRDKITKSVGDKSTTDKISNQISLEGLKS